MARAIAIFTGGVSELRQFAISETGQAYSRAQISHPIYGRSWSKWSATGETFGQNAMTAIDEVEVGFSKLRRASPADCFINNRALFDDKGNIRVRLPA